MIEHGSLGKASQFTGLKLAYIEVRLRKSPANLFLSLESVIGWAAYWRVVLGSAQPHNSHFRDSQL